MTRSSVVCSDGFWMCNQTREMLARPLEPQNQVLSSQTGRLGDQRVYLYVFGSWLPRGLNCWKGNRWSLNVGN